MVTVAWFGLGFAFFHWLVHGPSPVDLLLSWLVDHDTVYAEGYSERGWSTLRLGMTPGEVEQAIGPPLRKYVYPGEEVWSYTESPGDTHYWLRRVVFQGGRVSGFSSDFYFD